MNIKLIKQITVQDWDELVQKTYGKPYSFQQQDGCKSRGVETITTHPDWDDDYENTQISFNVEDEEMGVSFKTWINTSPEDTSKQFKYEWENNFFWERNFYPNANVIAQDLFKRGILEAGEYQIKINW